MVWFGLVLVRLGYTPEFQRPRSPRKYFPGWGKVGGWWENWSLALVWFGIVWFGLVWYGMVWFGMVWYGMVWYGSYEAALRISLA